MKTIQVEKPFSLRLNSDSPVRAFGKGLHKASDAELAHWFIKGCIAEGRAFLVAGTDSEEGISEELVTPSHDDLLKLKADQLKALAEDCGITVPDNATKAVIADLLLAGQEGVTLVNGPDGIFVQKAEA